MAYSNQTSDRQSIRPVVGRQTRGWMLATLRSERPSAVLMGDNRQERITSELARPAARPNILLRIDKNDTVPPIFGRG